MAALTAGVVAPDFSLPLLNPASATEAPTAGADGARFSLAGSLLRGPVVLAFFKGSCPVCQYALPFLERLHQAYRGKDVSVVGVSQDSRRDTAAFARQFGIGFPVALDDTAKYPVSNAYGLTNVPTLFYIAPGGEIEISSVGWVKAEVAAINARIAEALKGGAATIFKPGEQVADWRPG